MSTDLKVHGMEEKKRSLLLFVEKLHKLAKVIKLKFGAMVNKLDHFYILMTALKPLED